MEISKSKLERTFRLDSEFFKKEYLLLEKNLKNKPHLLLTDLVYVSDGNHMKISESFVETGIPYYRGQDISSFFIEQSNPICITKSAFDKPVMKRSYLKKNDILLSIVGTIGKLSLVKEENQATCSCKLAILRPKEDKTAYLSIFLESIYGKFQVQRLTRGAVQQGFLLEDMNQINVPIFSNIFKKKINININNAFDTLEESKTLYKQAENLLLEELGLLDYEPSKQSVSVKSLSQSFGSSGRLDSEYYLPKYDEIIEKIKSYKCGWENIQNVLTSDIKSGTTPKTIIKEYRESSNYFFRAEAFNDDLTLTYENLYSMDNKTYSEHPNISVKQNDILVSMTGTIGNVAIVDKDINGIINQNIVKLSAKDEIIKYFVLALYMKTIGKILLTREQTGNVQPYVNISNFSNLIVPLFEQITQLQIESKIKESFRLKKESQNLLELAKKAVEVAIEEGEDVAMGLMQA